MRIKGPWFPSYETAGTYPPAAPKKQWVSHVGRKQRIRALRQKCRTILNSKDADAIQAGRRLVQFTAFEKDVELVTLILASTAMDRAADQRLTWAEALEDLLTEIENAQPAQEPAKQGTTKIKTRIIEEPDGEAAQP